MPDPQTRAVTVSKREAAAHEDVLARVTVTEPKPGRVHFHKFACIDRTRERYQREQRGYTGRPEVVTDGGIIAGMILKYQHSKTLYDETDVTEIEDLTISDGIFSELKERGAEGVIR